MAAVAFVTNIAAPHRLREGESFDSDLASMRLRVGIPARELARRLPVWLVPLEHVHTDPDLAQLGSPEAVVVGKLPVRFIASERERAAALISWIERMSGSRRIVVDFSDNLGAAAALYSEPALHAFQRRVLDACPATVPCEALRQALLPDARRGITVIEDPFESPRAAQPRFSPGEVLRLAWFGVFAPEHRPFVEGELADVAEALEGRDAELAFVTHPSQAAVVEDMARALKALAPRFTLRHVPWSVAAVANELHHADLVVLPQDAGSGWGRVKSHNRLVETIRAGRLAVASPIPSYQELAEYAWVGEDLGAGVEWALANPQDAVTRIARGQDYVEQRFSPRRIADEWARVLGA